MADKKKTPSRSTTGSQTVEPKAGGGQKDQSKGAKAVTRERVERKAELSKPVRQESKRTVKGPPEWLVRLRKNTLIRFVLDSYYELRYKTTWPTFLEARNLTIVVILLSLAVGLILGGVDFGLFQVFTWISHISGQ